MNKNLLTGLFIVGLFAAMLVLADSAQAAGPSPASAAAAPYESPPVQTAPPVSRRGCEGGLMRGYGNGGLGNGGNFGQMPDWNQAGQNGARLQTGARLQLHAGDGQPENCPYWQEQQAP